MTLRKAFDYELLHPKARDHFRVLSDRLETAYKTGTTPTLFMPFEGYRDPQQQVALVKRGVSKARPWQSAHNYGLAVDYVALSDPRSLSSWDWDNGHDWDMLRTISTNMGMCNSISWDRPHVWHPIWDAVKNHLV